MRTIRAIATLGRHDARGVASASGESLLSRQGGIRFSSLAKLPAVGTANDAHACLLSKAR